MATNFEEKSGLVSCSTPWGSWGQTVEEIHVEINVKSGTKAKDVKCEIRPKDIFVSIAGQTILKGTLYGLVVADECVWTIEDHKLVRIILTKSIKDASNCWKSLLVDAYVPDPFTLQNMEKKLTLERFQKEHPGFDFSGADVTGNFTGGGPRMDED